jgi:hypothetical protein
MKAAITAANAVSVHVRRGDYISNPSAQHFHGTCGLDYYKKAVELILSKVNDPHFFIFSDDVKWVADNFMKEIRATIVDINDGSSAVKDMQLMSACKHHIIANSSFSWWGAWLGSNADKIVIGPRQWFADAAVDTGSVLPDSWYKL